MTTDLVKTNPWNEHNLTSKENYNYDSLCIVSKENVSKKLEEAKINLNENDKIKKQCLEQLREWIDQNRDIENCLKDDIFLLRFLRAKKYSLFMAQQMILKYLNMRKHFFQYIEIMDCRETKVNELVSKGYLFVSPFRDSQGRRVMIYNIDKFDLKKYTNIDMGRIHTITYETLLEDEETQILGVNHVANLTGISPAFATLFSIQEFTRVITWGEQSLPMRHKEIHLLNVPTALKYIFDYAISKMSKKLSERFELHESQASLNSRVDKNCLPLELGGVMPMSEMIDLWKKELLAKREKLMTFNDMKLLSDKGIISRRNIAQHAANGDVQSLTGSFRKLEVD